MGGGRATRLTPKHPERLRRGPFEPSRQSPRRRSPRVARTGDNAGMDAGELAAAILDAVRSGRDLYLYDRYIAGPGASQRAREMLIERRGASSDPDEVAFLTSVIRALDDAGEDH